MTEATAHGHSIWLTPDASTVLGIQQTIDTLSARFNSPVFQPHVTLIGKLGGDHQRVFDTFNTLIKGIKPFVLHAEAIDYQDVFFRSMFYKISETDDLMEMNQLARELYSRDSDPTYFPHLSLLYSDVSESEKRTAVLDLAIEIPAEIPITGIELIQTQGQVSEWSMVKRVELI